MVVVVDVVAVFVECEYEDADELAVARWISGCGAFLESDGE